MNTQKEIFTFINVWGGDLEGQYFEKFEIGVIYCSQYGIDSAIWARICKLRNRFPAWRVGTTTLLSYWPARLHRLTESINTCWSCVETPVFSGDYVGPGSGWPVDAGQWLTATLTGNRRLPTVLCWQLTACRLLLSISMSCWLLQMQSRVSWLVTCDCSDCWIGCVRTAFISAYVSCWLLLS